MSRFHRQFLLLLRAQKWALWVSVALLGCERPSEVGVTQFRAIEAADRAVGTWDENRDAALDRSELTTSPGLLAAFENLDANRDGKVTRAELVARLETYNQQRVEVMPFVGQVTLNGRPLANAIVTLEPEPFLREELPEATGRTSADGFFQLTVAGLPQAGIRPGIYRGRVSCLDENGTELVPERYKSLTVLGYEIAIDVRDAERQHVISMSN